MESNDLRAPVGPDQRHTLIYASIFVSLPFFIAPSASDDLPLTSRYYLHYCIQYMSFKEYYCNCKRYYKGICKKVSASTYCTMPIRNIATLYCNMTSISRTSLGTSQWSQSHHFWTPGRVPESVFSETLACQQTLQMLERSKDSRWKMMGLSLWVHRGMGKFNNADDNNLGYCICRCAFE